MRDHRLVRGDEGLAAAQAFLGERQGRAIRAADQLDHHVDIPAGGKFAHVVDPFIGRKVDAAILGAVARGDAADTDRLARTPRDQRRVLFDQTDDARAHGTQPDQRDVQRFPHFRSFSESSSDCVLSVCNGKGKRAQRVVRAALPPYRPPGAG